MIITALSTRNPELIKSYSELIQANKRLSIIRHIAVKTKLLNKSYFDGGGVILTAYDFIINSNANDITVKKITTLSSKLVPVIYGSMIVEERAIIKVLFYALLSMNNQTNKSLSNLITYYLSTLDLSVNYNDLTDLSDIIEGSIEL